MVTTIHIEGVDRTGKDTLAGALTKETELKYYITARSPISTYAYSVIYGRDGISLEELSNYFSNPEIFLVYLKPDRKVIDERCEKTGHEPVIDRDFDEFNYVVSEMQKVANVLIIEDINERPEVLAKRIAEEVRKCLKEKK